MADEHYEWLDKDAAERLLRREPVDPVGGQSRTEAERLAAALDAAARAARPATGELPGEAAALAAFRTAAQSARARTRAANPQVKGYAEKTAEPAPDGILEPVHIRPASGGFAPHRPSSSAGSGRTRSLGWSRPIRFGLVASFAGCALGGVAVAASTGMLPGPFGGRTPVPATSVSAAATPEELGSGPVTDESPSAQPPASPETGPSTPPADPSAPTGDRGNGRTGKGEDRKGDDNRKPGGTTNGTPNGTENGTENGKQSDGSGNGTSGNWYAKALKACRDYRDGKLDDDRRRYLEALAKGARNLDRFCDRMIAKNTDGQNSPGSGSGSEGEQGEDGDSNGDGDGSNTLPSIRFTTTPLPSPSPSTPASSPAADRASLGAVGSPG
ncbi:hypothetical protein [Streptomyces sp. Ncost-T10-10d]|uniref:hypothetical protein n=1 Tax=Streptomyces sp. Ncost-T10-10d TaxID=1839774 RepID=UPI00081D4DF1|nr:hypothetical protein [Streptomyces sp. Ncost-T10-10d]SCF96497.1 hypothetical protein GA0115254_128161 [Streptomyces sp. Ncost-T10-10d]